MRKANIASIIIAHVGTLRNAATGRLSFSDLAFFYLLPLLLALGGAGGVSLPESFYGLSVSVYSIFAALLISAQVALFTILTSVRVKSDDPSLERVLGLRRKSCAKLLREVNANISYLILLAVVSITAYVIFSVAPFDQKIETGLSVFLYSHFFLTLLMSIKRIFVAFDRGYADISS